MTTVTQTPPASLYRASEDVTPGIIVMGAAGCGKSTTGLLLANALGGAFIDADNLHPAISLAKMASGQPLTDDDRWPWLHAVAAVFAKADSRATAVIACSALRRVYRDLLRAGAERPLVFVHLSGTRNLHAERLRGRTGHFMPPTLLDSQLALLEPLQPDEDGVVVDIADTPEVIVDAVLRTLRAHRVTVVGQQDPQNI
ncbi:gluconokinase [Arthrobacter frigidicola]|nr:gluconokinase [Arthrobacter frigidicola]